MDDHREPNDAFTRLQPHAVNAEVSRGRAAGLYVDRKEILTGSIDKMSKVEVADRLKDLRNRFPEVIIDASHEEIESQD